MKSGRIFKANDYFWKINRILKAHLRPKLDGRASPNRPVGQIQILRTGGLQSRRWRPQPNGQKRPVTTGRFVAMNMRNGCGQYAINSDDINVSIVDCF